MRRLLGDATEGGYKMNATVLIVDDEKDVREALAKKR
jgi:hypothetical protein